jgi:hypothetical protein
MANPDKYVDELLDLYVDADAPHDKVKRNR